VLIIATPRSFYWKPDRWDYLSAGPTNRKALKPLLFSYTVDRSGRTTLKRLTSAALVSVFLLCTPAVTPATGIGKSAHSTSSVKQLHAPREKSPQKVRRDKCAWCPRDHHGKIKRSKDATRAFQRSHPCPSTGRVSGGCPGYVIDHVQALKRGGADSPSNMQWQTKAEARAKDRVE
jgi:hypothetical protein